MLRRAQYQFGPFLAKGVRGQVDGGLGKSMAAGAVALLRPTDLIIATGDKRAIDGVEFEFQMAPNWKRRPRCISSPSALQAV